MIQKFILVLFLLIFVGTAAVAQNPNQKNFSDQSTLNNDSLSAAKVQVKKSFTNNKKRLVFARVKTGGKSFLIASPKGWILDDKSGRDQGLDVVLYKEGWNLDYAPALIYTKIISKNGRDKKSFAEVIGSQVEQLKNYGAEIKKDSIAYTYENKQSVVVHFSDKTTGSHNLVSYINELDYIVSIILTSQKEKDFNEAKAGFYALINSYKRR